LKAFIKAALKQQKLCGFALELQKLH